MYQREAGIVRLSPKFGHSRYYYLRKLAQEIRRVVSVYLKPLQKVSRIADFGCGNMPYKILFEPFCEKYIGIDLPENPYADIHIFSDGKVNIGDHQIQVVLSTQVLEHVPNPNFYLQEAHRILEKNGLLILTTHGYWMFHPDPTDFWRWTSMGLRKIIEEAGFEILEFRGILGRSAIGMQLVQDGLMFKLPKFLRFLLTIPMQGLIFLLDKTHSQKARNADAGNFVVVARKK